MSTRCRKLLYSLACAFVLIPASAKAEEDTRTWKEVYPFCTGLPSCLYTCNPNTPECQSDPDCNCDCFN
jgi:hypothetical protein